MNTQNHREHKKKQLRQVAVRVAGCLLIGAVLLGTTKITVAATDSTVESALTSDASTTAADATTQTADVMTQAADATTQTADATTQTTDAADTTQEAASSKPVRRLKKVKGVALTRYSTTAIKVTWNKVKKAKYYRVYVAKKKNGKYRLAGITKKQHFLVKKLKNHKDYYFYVQACKKKKESAADSLPSKKAHMKTRTYTRKIVFAGDSICQGVGYYALPRMNVPGKKKAIAYKGLNTITFRTTRVFGGRSGLARIIEEKPYRVYIMLGINEIHYRKVSAMVPEYQSIVESIQKNCPDTDIVLCAVSPVTKSERMRRTGFKQIPTFNKKLKEMAKKTKTTYFDYTSFLKTKEGYLNPKYAAADGFHWTASAYAKFGKIAADFDRSLDE